eukprot:TRINITY_DN125_c0_g1_i1.p1 TRINITY_DN125_c0_g1~~TRINITY_DN125_c0_g1_i1.p1  ORF type:complete len:102 (-),score=28.68 TRINITY_DN125_c0_g1_i1:55-360(-)
MRVVLVSLLVLVVLALVSHTAGACSATAIGGHGRLAFICKADVDCKGCGSDTVDFPYVYCDKSYSPSVCHFNNEGKGVPSAADVSLSGSQERLLRKVNLRY